VKINYKIREGFREKQSSICNTEDSSVFVCRFFIPSGKELQSELQSQYYCDFTDWVALRINGDSCPHCVQDLATKRDRKGDSRKLFWRNPVARSLERRFHIEAFAATLRKIETLNVCPFAEWSYEGERCQHCARVWKEGSTVDYAIFERQLEFLTGVNHVFSS